MGEYVLFIVFKENYTSATILSDAKSVEEVVYILENSRDGDIVEIYFGKEKTDVVLNIHKERVESWNIKKRTFLDRILRRYE